jgi:hypothetical protein
MSTISETIYTLEQFNKWRRGNKKTTAPDPFEVGVAIGDAVRLLRELFAMTARAEQAEAKLAAEREKVKVMREALSYVAWLSVSNQAEIARDALAATKEASK